VTQVIHCGDLRCQRAPRIDVRRDRQISLSRVAESTIRTNMSATSRKRQPAVTVEGSRAAKPHPRPAGQRHPRL
jgi:hypothetical protein